MNAGREGQDQGDQSAASPVARPCPACRGSGVRALNKCPDCDGTGSGWKAAIHRAYTLGVGDGMAAMRNAMPNELHLQRDVDALVEVLKEWSG